MLRDVRDLVDGPLEGGFVRLRRNYTAPNSQNPISNPFAMEVL